MDLLARLRLSLISSMMTLDSANLARALLSDPKLLSSSDVTDAITSVMTLRYCFVFIEFPDCLDVRRKATRRPWSWDLDFEVKKGLGR